MIYLHNLAPTAPHKQMSGSDSNETWLKRLIEDKLITVMQATLVKPQF